MSWPTAYRRSYNYLPQTLLSELTAPSASNQWDIAQDPYAYDQQPDPDYYSEPQWSDIEVRTRMSLSLRSFVNSTTGKLKLN
jgi:hypothetical protein